MVLALAFGEHQERVAGGTQLGDAVLPELEGHVVGGIAAETVDADLLHPELHRIDHCLAHAGIVEVEVGDVVPARSGRVDDLAVLVMSIPVGVVLDPLVVPGSMVRDPVDDDCHAPGVGVRNHLLEVIERAEFGIDRLVVLYAVRTLYGFLDADLADGHEPHYVRS